VHEHPTTAARRASPLRGLVLAVMAVFWATLLLALGFPGARMLLVAALVATAAIAARRLLAGRLRLPQVTLRRPQLPRVNVAPALERTAAVARRARLPRPPSIDLAPVVSRGRAALRSVRPTPVRRTAAAVTPPAENGRAGEAWELCRLGAQLRQQGRLAAAVESFETAVWIFRDLEEPRGLALALNGLGLALVRQRRLDAAVACYREAVAILDGLGDAHAHGQVLANLGTALRTQGRSDEARASWEDALAHLEPGSAEYDRIRELRAAS
jgi:tetratricopeptide (TPR) repeat protein